jgi:hypothetical protein
MFLNDKNLKCIDFRDEKLFEVLFMHTQVKKGGFAEVFAKLIGHHYVKFGNHCIC